LSNISATGIQRRENIGLGRTGKVFEEMIAEIL
jgi:hypothetical protein